jgi:aminoglycoside 3-N-acetyltransferase
VSLLSQSRSHLRAGLRSTLRRFLSQDRRTELKRLQGVTRKKFAPVLATFHGRFTTEELIAALSQRLPADFEILMVHSSFDTLLPMYRGNAKELLAGLIDFCGPNRTLVMPSFVMGGRSYDAGSYFASKPFDVRTTPSEMGMVAEIFRRTPGVVRSLHPTASVCALGPLARELTTDHHLSEKGLGPDSPFGVMTRRSTAITGIGVEYFRCLTHVHAASQKMGDAYPVKLRSITTPVTLVDYQGNRHDYQLGLPDRSKKLDLTVLWSILSKDELREWTFHGVPLFVVPSAGVLTDRLIEAAGRGITVFGRVPIEPASVAASAHPAPQAKIQ